MNVPSFELFLTFKEPKDVSHVGQLPLCRFKFMWCRIKPRKNKQALHYMSLEAQTLNCWAWKVVITTEKNWIWVCVQGLFKTRVRTISISSEVLPEYLLLCFWKSDMLCCLFSLHRRPTKREFCRLFLLYVLTLTCRCFFLCSVVYEYVCFLYTSYLVS